MEMADEKCTTVTHTHSSDCRCIRGTQARDAAVIYVKFDIARKRQPVKMEREIYIRIATGELQIVRIG